MTPTPEQASICHAVASGDNVMVEALAGCAKSTTIHLALPERRSTVVLAFNKKIKDEMEKRIGPRDNVKVLTLNGLGHQAIKRSLRGSLVLDNDKVYNLAREVGLKKQDLQDTITLVRAARMAGFVPKGMGRSLVPESVWDDLVLDLDVDPILVTPAQTILRKSISLAMQGTIDYDDQIYISTLIFGSYPKFDVLFVDEAQDLSPLNHLQLSKAAGDQIVAVGDPHQAIYAWRGADHMSMTNLRALRPAWTDLQLSLTFRCPKSVVARQQSFVPHFRAAEGNLEGSISRLREWTPSGGANAAILCRNNAPLIRLAFRLLRAQVPVNFLGKDIGANMKRLYNKLSGQGRLSLESTIANAWAYAKEHPDKLDKAESLVAILESHSSVDSALKFLTEARTNSISLATGHKAKGLEWDKVYHLNPALIPSKWVQDMEPPPGEKSERYESALQQEDNLRYVIETRTKDQLLFANLDQLQ